jgi:hypothetical protein
MNPSSHALPVRLHIGFMTKVIVGMGTREDYLRARSTSPLETTKLVTAQPLALLLIQIENDARCSARSI